MASYANTSNTNRQGKQRSLSLKDKVIIIKRCKTKWWKTGKTPNSINRIY